MPQGISRRTPQRVGSDAVGKSSTNAIAAPAPGQLELRPSGDYRRIDLVPDRPSVAIVSAPAVLPAERRSAESLEEFVFEHGEHFDSYLATEPGRLSFWSRAGHGLISYTRRGRYVLVGGGLIAPSQHKEALLAEFVEYASQHQLRVAFHNITDDELPLFRGFGFQVTKWGEEPVVDLGSCTWGGKAFEWVRRQTNFCQRHSVTAFEVRPDELEHEHWNRTLAEVLEVSAESLTLKPQADEMKFFEGRIDNHRLGLRRLFVARSGHGAGRMEGFVICNPMLGGTMWSTELYRHRRDAVRGTIAYLFHHLMQQLQAEGVSRVGLCLDPGLRTDTPIPGDSFLVRRGMSFSDRHLGLVFDNAGLRHFKTRFRPRYENRYICARPGVSFGSLLAFVSVFGVFNLSYSKLARIIIDRLRKRASRKTLSDAA
jgi:phosphatidylglycerol lysyltransferase